MGVSHSSENRCEHKPGCVFCDIIHGKQQARIVYQDDLIVAFEDIAPAAAKHLLVVSREHIPSIEDVSRTESYLLTHMRDTGARLLRDYQPADRGVASTSSTSHLEATATEPIHLGFHVPPFSSVYHLHLHCLQEPFVSSSASYKYSDWGVGFVWWRNIDDFIGTIRHQLPDEVVKGKDDAMTLIPNQDETIWGELDDKDKGEGGA